jgi:hypothetical protein
VKAFGVLLSILLLLPALSQSNVNEFESGFRAGYEDGSWEYRDYNFNLSASAPSDSVSGYNAGYMLAKGVPIFMPCGGDSKRYNEGFKAGYEDGSWEYREYNFNLSGRMKSADEGFFSGYVNGYILGQLEKRAKAEKLEDKVMLENSVKTLEDRNRALESSVKTLEDRNRALESSVRALEGRNIALENSVRALESRVNALERSSS